MAFEQPWTCNGPPGGKARCTSGDPFPSTKDDLTRIDPTSQIDYSLYCRGCLHKRYNKTVADRKYLKRKAAEDDTASSKRRADDDSDTPILIREGDAAPDRKKVLSAFTIHKDMSLDEIATNVEEGVEEAFVDDRTGEITIDEPDMYEAKTEFLTLKAKLATDMARIVHVEAPEAHSRLVDAETRGLLALASTLQQVPEERLHILQDIHSQYYKRLSMIASEAYTAKALLAKAPTKAIEDAQ